MSSAFAQRLSLALRNVFRQRMRSAGPLAAISLGVAGLILAAGFVQDIFIQLARRSFTRIADISRLRAKVTARGAPVRRKIS